MSSRLSPLKIINFIIKNDLILPIIILISYIIFVFIIRGVIPTSDELIETFRNIYERYGYEIILISAILESLIFINFIAPGQLAMALGVIFARTGQTDFTLVLLMASFGALIGYNVDYFLGYFGFSDPIRRTKYGFMLDQARDRVSEFGSKGLILGFIHTNIGAFVSTAAGILRFNWFKFLVITILSTFSWSVVWGLVIYAFGDIVLIVIRKYSFVLLLAFIAWILLSRIWQNSSKK